MCRRWFDPKPCKDFKCPHNLFWEQLRLNLNKIQITDKASEIRNCCCLIDEPWTPEEIGDIWGFTGEGIRQCEALAWRKVQKECYVNNERNKFFHISSKDKRSHLT